MISKENAEHYTWGDSCDGWHLVKTPRLSVIQEVMPGGKSEVRHFHRVSEQFFYVLSGTASLEVDDQHYLLTAGQGHHVPAGVPHQLRNEQLELLEFIVTSTPPSHGDRVAVAQADPIGSM